MKILSFHLLTIFDLRGTFRVSKRNLPAGLATTLQVTADLGVGSDAVVQSHHFGVAAEHGLVLHVQILHATIEHHVAPHHLEKKRQWIRIKLDDSWILWVTVGIKIYYNNTDGPILKWNISIGILLYLLSGLQFRFIRMAFR